MHQCPGKELRLLVRDEDEKKEQGGREVTEQNKEDAEE